MDGSMSSQEQQLCQFLMGLPAQHKCRYTEQASRDLLGALFWSMAGGREDYLKLFFPDKGGPARPNGTLKLREAQGAVDGAEYTEAARGKACGHIFKPGEATYGCRTCSADDTCCLCSRCFDSTDHTGHMVRISISPGNSGCCDCGDPEAWKVPMFCTIHSVWEEGRDKGKGKKPNAPPEDLVANIRMTIGRVIDYLCDVISCSPEQLRSAKTIASIEHDERYSRLSSTYGGGDVGPPEEYCVLLWNDEKHTIIDVRDQVARACRIPFPDALKRAYETDAVGRSLLHHSTSIAELLEIAKILEHIKVTVTIRSSRDVFREQMCGTIIEWLSDISGCSVGSDHSILRHIVCEEMLKPWRQGSPASHAIPGENGIDDEELIDQKGEEERASLWWAQARILEQTRLAAQAAGIIAPDSDSDDFEEDADMDGDNDNRSRSSHGEENDDQDVDDDDDGHDHDHNRGGTGTSAAIVTVTVSGAGGGAVASGSGSGNGGGGEGEGDDEDVIMLDAREAATDVNMSDWRQASVDQSLEEDEATIAGYPPPPPPPPAAAPRRARDRDVTPSDSDTAEPLIAPTVYAKTNLEIPKTPGVKKDDKTTPPNPGRYWLGVPQAYMERDSLPVSEDLFQRVRLDWMVLFDLRMWKKVRNDLRSLYISTVVTIPEFKRVLGLRFAGLYTTLAQLYLIGDREPDHSIINISLQMLTTPSITAEIVERGNFLTSLMAILYTFLTTRQVGHPWDVSSNAVLAFDTGSVTNRRMYHFFLDLKYLFGSPHVQERLRTDERYMLQFLDLVKLHQGICPNTRAIGEHVEYETDTWINASLITREINRLCRQFSESFRNVREEDMQYVYKAIRIAAKSVMINSIGAERSRFSQAEIKDEVRFKTLADFEFDGPQAKYEVVKFVVEEQPISFHHALHYTLSWLVECGKSMSAEQLRVLLSFSAHELKARPRSMGRKVMPRREFAPEDYLMAAFDYPLRVCAWLSQMKAGMWVRNGMSLRHQSGTYRGVSHRDVSHHRDIFLLQTAMVTCDPSRVLASIVDRFGMEKWVKGFFEQKATAQDDIQHLDVVEDMVHLLIVLLSDRTSLLPTEVEPNPHLLAMRRDVTHVLCFKPLSFSEICNKLPDKYQEMEDFHRVLDEITNFKPPEGISDVGTFELKPQFVEDIDPYIAHYNKNQREEAENAYRKHKASRIGKPAEEVVFEPKLRPIPSGVFVGLANFTRTGMFAQIIYYSLLYPLVAQQLTPHVPFTRVETFLAVVLHLILIAISEDKSSEGRGEEGTPSFIENALTRVARSNFMADAPTAKTIVSLLDLMSTKPELKACHAKMVLILKRMRQRRPRDFESAYQRLGMAIDRIVTASPANNTSAEEERERKKKAALERQARVMAQFQQQQKSFLENQAHIDWGDDLEEEEEEGGGRMDDGMGGPHPLSPSFVEEHKNFWRYPAGTCILCQEDTDDRRLYGTFAFVTESQVLRQTDLQDPDFVREAANTPKNLDRSAESIRPFGVAHENRKVVEKVNSAGETFVAERQVIGKGFPARNCVSGPVSVGCGHIMHYGCFEMYFKSTISRHSHQIARHHPENTESLEFVCPLCKALGNAFLPIVWKGMEESYPGVLQPRSHRHVHQHQHQHGGHQYHPLLHTNHGVGYGGGNGGNGGTDGGFTSFLESHLSLPGTGDAYYALGAHRPLDQVQNSFRHYTQNVLLKELADRSSQLLVDVWEPPGVPGQQVGGAASSSSASGAGGVGGGGGARQAAARLVSNIFGPQTPGAAAALDSPRRAGTGATTASTSAAAGGPKTGGDSSDSMLKELVTVYRRLRDTLRRNGIHTQHVVDAGADDSGVASPSSSELFGSDMLARTVGFSISAVEIQQRGTDAEYGMTFLEKIPDQALTHLRILAETVDSFISVGGQRLGGDNRVEAEYRRDSERQHCQLFMAQYVGQETETTRRPVDTYTPLLAMDPFVFLCECVFGVARLHNIETAHLLRLCYLAEITKVVYHMGRNVPGQAWISPLVNPETDDPALRGFAAFCLAVVELDMTIRTRVGGVMGLGTGGVAVGGGGGRGDPTSSSSSPSILDVSILAADSLGANKGFAQPGLDSLDGYYSFVRRYALAFLRKCVVLLHVKFGVDFNSHVSARPELDELERLTEALRLPSFDDMCASLTGGVEGGSGGGGGGPRSSTGWPPAAQVGVGVTRRLVGGWIRHDVMHPRKRPASASSSSASASASALAAGTALSSAFTTTMAAGSSSNSSGNGSGSAVLSHPGIFELVGLPMNYDQLIEECTRRRCPTTGKDVSDPMICLMCGEVFCGQGICCLKEEKAEGGREPKKIGGSQQHMRRCHKNVGLFINIRKCAVFYVHRMSGAWSNAPYIDKYGESDLGLRHGRQLFLNQRRYDTMLRSMWLGHGIPSFISRRLEADINNGGWETI